MSGILVYSELEETSLGLLTKGRSLAAELNKPLYVALLGQDSPQPSKDYFSHGASRIYVGDDPALDPFHARTYAAALAQIVDHAQVEIVLVGSTQRGRELAPSLAQKLSAGCLTDATNLYVDGERLIVERRALGGNTIAVRFITSTQQVISVMPKLYDPEPGNSGEGEVISVPLSLEPSNIRLVDLRPKEAAGVNIEEAEVLVCFGRGVANQDDLNLIQNLADSLDGMVGCTRPMSHDYHWIAEDQMIGISGKEINPLLYIGVGVSGQIQHTVGIMNSKVIVAINKDPNALIFKMADYGIVGDLYQVVPQLIDALRST
ncbi:MAG: electron transfer flavoprotein subunit alpha/FixB family protein [Anaerolineales bacterium]|nr:electron transfer flavoprotein subunit alpha/FixB family protein [Anaerolineales bacterium]